MKYPRFAAIVVGLAGMALAQNSADVRPTVLWQRSKVAPKKQPLKPGATAAAPTAPVAAPAPDPPRWERAKDHPATSPANQKDKKK